MLVRAFLPFAALLLLAAPRPASGATADPGVLVLDHPGINVTDQPAFGSRRIIIKNGAILRLGSRSKQAAGGDLITNDIEINRGIIEAAAGNPHFTGDVTIGPGGATLITHSKGHDMSFDSDITGAGPLFIDNDSSGTGGTVRFTNDFSLMGTVTLNGVSPGYSGGRIYLGDPDALNQATLVAIAGMRGIDFDPEIKMFSFGGITGDANIDIKGKILRVGVANTDLVYSGNLTDSVGGGGLIKSGSGTMTLRGRQRAITTMTVSFGALLIAGSVDGEIKVGDPRNPLARAVLSGTGSIGDILLQTPGAVVQPGMGGNSTGILNARNFSMIPGSNLSIRIGGKLPGGAASHGYDQVRASGQLSLYGNLDLSIIGGFQPKPGDAFYIIATDNAAPVLGRFTNIISNELTVAGHRFRINYSADSARGDPGSTTGHDIALIALAGG